MKVGERFNPFQMFTGLFIPIWLAGSPRLSPGAKLCYGRLTQLSGDKGECWPGQQSLAKLFKVNERQIRRYLTELEEEGFIAIQQRGLNRSNVYVFLWHEEIEAQPIPAQVEETEGSDVKVRSKRIPERTYRSDPDISARSKPAVNVRSKAEGNARSPIGRQESSTRIIESSSSALPVDRSEGDEDLSQVAEEISRHAVATDSEVAAVAMVARAVSPDATASQIALAVKMSVPKSEKYSISHVRYFLTAVPRTMSSAKFRNALAEHKAAEEKNRLWEEKQKQEYEDLLNRLRVEDPDRYRELMAEQAEGKCA
ncbi:MAG TPA: helix-turn-helix domain-containing protein [Bryobacteraceae bacterium]|nr:helix-turn-helix domain-containing protein [Bryobacteraceae bacterium]